MTASCTYASGSSRAGVSIASPCCAIQRTRRRMVPMINGTRTSCMPRWRPTRRSSASRCRIIRRRPAARTTRQHGSSACLNTCVAARRALRPSSVSLRVLCGEIPYPFRSMASEEKIMKFAQRMGRLGTETAFEVLVRAKALEAQGCEVIHLEIGEPDFNTPAAITEAACDALRAGYTHYTPAPGMPALREAIAADATARRGVTFSPDEDRKSVV